MTIWIVRGEGCLHAFSTREKAESFLPHYREVHGDGDIEHDELDGAEGMVAKMFHHHAERRDGSGKRTESFVTLVHPDEMADGDCVDDENDLVFASSWESADKARKLAEDARKGRTGEYEHGVCPPF